jgi:hypothetical protein
MPHVRECHERPLVLLSVTAAGWVVTTARDLRSCAQRREQSMSSATDAEVEAAVGDAIARADRPRSIRPTRIRVRGTAVTVIYGLPVSTPDQDALAGVIKSALLRRFTDAYTVAFITPAS